MGDISTTNAPLNVTAAAALTVAPKALLDTGTGTISLAADANAGGTGNTNSGELSIASSATVVTDNASTSAIRSQRYAIDIDTGPDPAVVGARRADLPSTPSTTLTGAELSRCAGLRLSRQPLRGQRLRHGERVCRTASRSHGGRLVIRTAQPGQSISVAPP